MGNNHRIITYRCSTVLNDRVSPYLHAVGTTEALPCSKQCYTFRKVTNKVQKWAVTYIGAMLYFATLTKRRHRFVTSYASCFTCCVGWLLGCLLVPQSSFTFHACFFARCLCWSVILDRLMTDLRSFCLSAWQGGEKHIPGLHIPFAAAPSRSLARLFSSFCCGAARGSESLLL